MKRKKIKELTEKKKNKCKIKKSDIIYNINNNINIFLNK